MAKKVFRLSAAGVKTANPGIHVDGGGLMLVVKPSGSATWVLRYQLAGKRRDMGLGRARGVGAVGLAEARERAAEARKLAGQGLDPLDERRAAAEATEAEERAAAAAAEIQAMTFRRAARQYIDSHEAGWKNAKHRQQWGNTLASYAYPHFGDLPVADIGTAEVLAALQPLWTVKPETATRLRGRIEAVLDFARVRGWREGENPARWRGHLSMLFPQRGKVAAVRHHAALPWGEMPDFMRGLRGRTGSGARALEFAILAAARSGEVRGARWGEVDLEAAVWTIPAARMKAGREHRVPLSEAALAVLRAVRVLTKDPKPGDLVFPGAKQGVPLSDMSLTAVLRRMGRGDLTAHGFRSTFRDWAGEATGHPSEVAEMALAHAVGNKVEAAYRRGDLFEKRRRVMADWAAYCGQEAGGNVVPLRVAGAVG